MLFHARHRHAPIVVHGVLEGGNMTINGGISSQFISSLLISCPFAKQESHVQIEGELKSKPYVEVTMEMLRPPGNRDELQRVRDPL